MPRPTRGQPSWVQPASPRPPGRPAARSAARELQTKIAARLALDSQAKVSLPGDPMLAAAVTWSKQNMADLTQQADNLNIRLTNQGTVSPPPTGTLPSIRFEGAGFPDYPW